MKLSGGKSAGQRLIATGFYVLKTDKLVRSFQQNEYYLNNLNVMILNSCLIEISAEQSPAKTIAQ